MDGSVKEAQWLPLLTAPKETISIECSASAAACGIPDIRVSPATARSIGWEANDAVFVSGRYRRVVLDDQIPFFSSLTSEVTVDPGCTVSIAVTDGENEVVIYEAKLGG